MNLVLMNVDEDYTVMVRVPHNYTVIVHAPAESQPADQGEVCHVCESQERLCHHQHHNPRSKSDAAKLKRFTTPVTPSTCPVSLCELCKRHSC